MVKCFCAQEKLIDHLEAGESCIQIKKERTRPHLTAASKLWRAQTDQFNLLHEYKSVQDRVSETATVRLPQWSKRRADALPTVQLPKHVWQGGRSRGVRQHVQKH